jgi:hypothetical protein
VSILDSQPSSVTEGRYVATSLTEGVQVAYDWFSVKPVENGLLIESRHTVMGVPTMPVQHAQFTVGADWTPRYIRVQAEPLFSLEVEFADQVIVMSISEKDSSRKVEFPIGRDRALFLLNGGLYFPLHIVRRFDFTSNRPQQFSIVPTGMAEVSRLEDIVEDGETLRLLETQISLPGYDEVLRLYVSTRGDLVRYQARNQNVVVKLEESGRLC